jgi:Sec-independent protein translocase protein TatA
MMTGNDTQLFREAIKSMQSLAQEMSEFRGEMKEFKESVKERITSLEKDNHKCQVEPSTCSNARKIDDHIKNHSGTFGKVFTALSVCIALIALLVSFF